MTEVSSLYSMSLDQARKVLDGIGYREDWTIPQLIDATRGRSPDRVIEALKITAAAAHAKANQIAPEAAR